MNMSCILDFMNKSIYKLTKMLLKSNIIYMHYAFGVLVLEKFSLCIFCNRNYVVMDIYPNLKY